MKYSPSKILLTSSLILMLSCFVGSPTWAQNDSGEKKAKDAMASGGPEGDTVPEPATAATNEEMVELGRYLGEWVAEKRKDPNDREFQFSYKLEWFDHNQSLVKMTIQQEYSDGETMLLWEGFKGWNPVKKVVFYHGFSPSGRSGSGTLRKEGNLLHTEYEGYDGRGNGVELRDTFTPLSPDSFRSETNIQAAGEWKSINVEVWHRRN